MDVLKEIYDDITNEENKEVRYAFFYFLFIGGVIFISLVIGFYFRLTRDSTGDLYFYTYPITPQYTRKRQVYKPPPKASPKKVVVKKRQQPRYRISNLMD